MYLNKYYITVSYLNMPLIVKPISANLTSDKDTFGKSVNVILYRILIASFLLEIRNKEHKLVQVEEKAHNGQIHSNLIRLANNLKSNVGMMILLVMI
jgi:hypothetical protein